MAANMTGQIPSVPLGTAITYGVLAGDTITNTGATTIHGDLGLYPGTSVTGDPTVIGTSNVTNDAASLAKGALNTAFLNAQGRTGPTAVAAGTLGGLRLTPGLYKDDGSASLGLTGTLTLDFQGNPNAVFIFQSASTLTTEVGSTVALINNGGGTGCNVFWQVGSSATLKGSTSFVGTILAYKDISVGDSATVAGRLLAGGQANGVGALTLMNNTITAPVCSEAPTGSIQVVKNTVGGNGTFAFTSNFGLTSPLITNGNTVSQTVSSLAPGSSYSVSETVPSGWMQTSASCTDGTPDAITVAAGATTTCTFTNTVVVPTGSIRLVKNTVNGDGTFAFTSNFGLTSITTNGGTASQTFSGLPPGGGYSVSEIVPSGWVQTFASCTNGTLAAITVAAGATTTCTIINTQQGSIRLVKNTVGGDGTFSFSSSFGLGPIILTTSGGTASQTFSNLRPGGSYGLSETVPSGWTQTSATCNNGTPAAITVAAGVTTTCIITNTRVAPTGSIQVVKNTVGGDGTFAITSNFGLTSLTTRGGTGSLTIVNLAPGSSYSVSETVPSGWAQTGASCNNGTPTAINVAAGVTTTCIITNTRVAPTGSIQVVKNTVGGNGTFAFTSNFGLSSLTTSVGTASQTFSNLTPGGGYSLSETVPSGWTQTGASCNNGTPAAITVVAGVTTICTITNTPMAVAVPDLTIGKRHAGNFHQGDTGDTYALTVTNAGQGPTTGEVTVSDALPAGLTATAIGGTGWTCVLATLICTRSDALAPGASYPDITVTVNVAGNPLAFNTVAGSPAFQTGDILISMADGTVEWRHRDWTLVKVLASGTGGQAKGMAFDGSGNLFVTHWYGTDSSGNDVMTFDRNGNGTGFFGNGFDCNPSSIVFDNSGNAYVGHADCSTQVFKFDSLGNRLAQYSVAVENRGSYHVVLDSNQCTMYYTSEGPNVKRFDVCSNTQMPDFNSAPLPDPVGGAQEFSLLPGGGMLVADFNVIARLDASGNLVRTYDAPANNCWLGMALDLDGTSFWGSNWCASSVTRFDLATGDVIESHVVDPVGFMVKQLAIPGNIFPTTVTNTAAVAGGGERNTSNDSASDPTTINPPAQPPAANHSAGIVNAASYVPAVAAGSIASVLGSSLSSVQAVASTIPLPATLASASFQIGGRAAPLFFVSPSQVNLQIPWELAGQPQAMVTATVGATLSYQHMMSLAPFAPGLFTLDEANSSQGVVTIAGTPLFAAPQSVPVSRPAHPGELIAVYCTGLGAVSNQPATGTAAPASPLSVTIATPTVTVGGILAQVAFSGLAPGAVGLYQVNVQVPVGAPAGDAVPVILSIGGVASNTVTIAVQ
jgi:uncharacterized protein (TIGR03437 family)